MLEPIAASSFLIDQVFQRLLAAIADGTLAPSQRIRQAELAESMGVSRQPISHALYLLKQQGLVEDSGRKGLRVARIDPARIPQLYQVRGAVDGLAARLAAERVAAGDASADKLDCLRDLVASGLGFDGSVPTPVLVRADTNFHRALYQLAANPVIQEMMAPLWPHLMRSMTAVLATPGYLNRVWAEHATILRHVETGDAGAAEQAARDHTNAAAARTSAHFRSAARAA